MTSVARCVHASGRRTMTVRDELLFGRPLKLKVFVSSEMRSKRLAAERVAAATAVEELGIHFAWYWERDANAGPFSSEVICLGHARTSDCLLLILGETLTDITRQEYFEAERAGASCFIFIKAGCTRDAGAEQFLAEERSHVTYKTFDTAADLRTAIVEALLHHAVQATRRDQMTRHPAFADQTAGGPLAWARRLTRG